MNIAKKLLLAAASCVALSAHAYDYSNYSGKFSNDDYREALNMGLKFFGGQRCGDSHNWMLVENPSVTKKYCHTQDGKGAVNGGGKGSYDLTGGWHDCGDHIKVAVTMGSSAAALAIAYDIWPLAFQDNYDGAYGGKNNIPDVLDELKYATDYFMKSFIDDNTFAYYVGFEGDHNVWMTSSKQSEQSVQNGGDPRPVWTSNSKGGPQAANYASALALMAIHYPDAVYKEQCRTYAIKAYNFAVKNKSSHASIPMFYSNPNEEWTDELALAAILLHKLTGDNQYLNDALGYLNNKWESNSPLAWDTMSDYAYYYIIKARSDAGNGSGGYISQFLEKNVFNLHLKNGEKDANGFPYYTNNWGTNKLACGGAIAAALFVKLVEDGVISTSQNIQKAKNFNQRIVDYVLGHNEFNHTFLHGFKGDMTYRLHHRNAMGRNDNPGSNVKNTCDFMFASGGMIGGPSSTGVFSNVIEGGASYTETEGGCDYNAAFVAAIASVVEEADPAPSDAVNVLTDRSYSVYPTTFDDYFIIDMIERANSEEITAELFNMEGELVYRTDLSGKISEIIKTPDFASGIYVLKISDDNYSASYKLIKK
jgi:hypothetical protein